jgi:hypothetical protein
LSKRCKGSELFSHGIAHSRAKNHMKPKFEVPKNEIAQALVSFKSAFRTVGIFSAIINLLMLVPSLYSKRHP